MTIPSPWQAPSEELYSSAQREHHPAAWREILQWLESRSVHELRELARNRKASEHATRKTELVAELVGLLANPENVQQALSTLTEGERAALELVYIVAAHEGLRREELQKAMLAWYGPILAKDAEEYINNLTARGLLFCEESPEHGPRRCRIPKAVSACLTFVSKRVDVYALERAESPVIHEMAASALLQAVSQFWQYIQAHEIRLQESTPGSLENVGSSSPPEALAELPEWLRNEGSGIFQAGYRYATLSLPSQELLESDLRALVADIRAAPRMLDFIYHLLLELGLTTRVGDTLEINQLAIERYVKHGEIQRLQALASAWLSIKSWSELSLVLERNHHLRLRRLPDAEFELEDLFEDLVVIRQFITRLLSLLGDDRWHSVDALLEIIWQLCPDLSCLYRTPRHPLPQWWFDSASPTAHPLTPYDRVEWQKSYGPLFVAFLEGPLHWLGSVSLAYEHDKLVAFRLTGLGKYLLGHYPQIIAGRGDMRPITVGENLTISIQLGRVDAEVHDFLGQFTDLVDAESDIFRYRITPQRLNQAFESGVELQTILSFLERVSGATVPDAARHTLEAWWQSYGAVRLYENPTLIEFADDYALQELLGTTSLAEHLIFQLSPRLVVIQAESVETLMAEMVKKGYTPKLKETL